MKKKVDKWYIAKHIRTANQAFDWWLFPIFFILVFGLIILTAKYVDPTVKFEMLTKPSEIATILSIVIVALLIIIPVVVSLISTAKIAENLKLSIREDELFDKKMRRERHAGGESRLHPSIKLKSGYNINRDEWMQVVWSKYTQLKKGEKCYLFIVRESPGTTYCLVLPKRKYELAKEISRYSTSNQIYKSNKRKK